MSRSPYDTSRSAEGDLVRRTLNKDEAAVRSIIGQHNRRLCRVARSMVRDDGDAEDVEAKTGKELWSFNTGSGVVGSPITWEERGEQLCERTFRLGRRSPAVGR